MDCEFISECYACVCMFASVTLVVGQRTHMESAVSSNVSDIEKKCRK